MMVWTKVKVAAVVLAGLALVGGGVMLAAGVTSAPSTAPAGQASAAETKGDGTGSAATPDARSLLKQVLDATSNRPPLYWKGVVQLVQDGKEREADHRASVTVFTAGAKVDVAADHTDLLRKRTWHGRQIWNGEQYFMMTDHDRENDERAGVQGVLYGTSVDPKMRSHVLGNWVTSSFIDGHLGAVEAYNGYAAQPMIEAADVRLAGKREAVEGVSCWRVDATTPLRKVKMWVDPNSGNLPKKIVIERGPGDVLGGSTVDEGDSYVTEIITHQMQRADGVWMASDVTATITVCHDGKPHGKAVMHARRTEVHVLPEAELERMGAFALGAAADGTVVRDFDDVGVSYRFRGGQIIGELDPVPEKQ